MRGINTGNPVKGTYLSKISRVATLTTTYASYSNINWYIVDGYRYS